MGTFSPPKGTQWDIDTDVTVIGGGPAGVCAAIAAAREGVSVLLIEQNGFSGGMATAGLVGPFMTCYDRSGSEMIIRGLFSEIVDRLVERGGAIHPSLVRSGTSYTSWIVNGHDHCTPFDAEILKKLLDDMLTEAGVNILYHSSFLRPILENNRIVGVTALGKGHIIYVKAKTVIDCTGDGEVAFSCGTPYKYGNEEENLVQPASMFFRICNVDSDKVIEDIEKNRDKFRTENGINYRCFNWYISKAIAEGEWDINRVSLGMYRSVSKDEWCINTSRIMGVDATDPKSLTAGEIEGRRQVEEILNFLHKYVPGCENAKLMSSGSTLGIRESRHIKGEYLLTADDILNAAVPEDAIALCSNSIDFHGRFGPKTGQYIVIKNGDYYGIPYRSLVPEKTENLLIAGRCISAESVAASAVRVMPPCMAMGQAAGTAAAIAVKSDVNVRDINTEILRNTLKNRGAYL